MVADADGINGTRLLLLAILRDLNLPAARFNLALADSAVLVALLTGQEE